MSVLGNRSSPEDPAPAGTGYRPKPFLTILDSQGAPLGSARQRHSRSKPALPSMQTLRRGARAAWFRERDGFGKMAGAALGLFRTGRTHASKEATLPETLAAASTQEPKQSFPEWLRRFDPKIILSMWKSLDRRTLVAVLAAALSLAAVGGALLASVRVPLKASNLLLPDEDSVQQALLSLFEPEDGGEGSKEAAALAPLPVSVSIQSYTIRNGDTLDRIAKRFGLRQDTIISLNNLRSQASIRPGVQLRIPNIDGVNHRVRSGESLSSISRSYGIDMTAVVDANDLASSTISSGQTLFIPKARLASATLRDFYGERFVWPARGRVSSPYGYRIQPFTGLRSFHSAVDIVLPIGTRVKATAEGKVGDTGYNSVFGHYVILKHANGYQSLYAHLSSIAVKEGSFVDQGAAVGLSGNSGQSTGPHLHFSLFKNGQALDPLKYVK